MTEPRKPRKLGLGAAILMLADGLGSLFLLGAAIYQFAVGNMGDAALLTIAHSIWCIDVAVSRWAWRNSIFPTKEDFNA
jgi:hypothetical protein